MLKKTITYKDLEGNEVVDDFYFNLSKAELIEMELEQDGGFEDYLKKLIKTKDGAKIIAAFKFIVLKSYGVKSEDGKRFIKNEQLREEFQQTDAYSQLFMELALDADAAAKFINGVVPSDLAEEVAKSANAITTQELPEEKEKEFKDYSDEELLEMDQDDFLKLVGDNPRAWNPDQLRIAYQRKVQ